MNKHLAKLILEYGEEFYPFLRLLALHTVNVSFDDSFDPKKFDTFSWDSESVDAIVHSDLAEYDGEKIRLTKEGRYLFEPVEMSKVERKETNYIPKDLEQLAKEVGMPPDFYSNTGKYIKLFRTITKSYNEQQIEKTKNYFIKIKEPEWDLKLFLTNQAFNNFFKLSYRQPDSAATSREEGEYYDDQSFSI